jgi:sugar/nucleoside kinase (ribokinase family)
VNTLVIHPAYALTVSNGKADVVAGSVCARPKITTGAGDHFNSGFCLGKLLGLDDAASLLCGVSASSRPLRPHGRKPDVADLAAFMKQWPAN